MQYRAGVGPAALGLAAALLSFGGLAQTRTAPATMTDAAPLPAEDRDSTGALLLDRSLQRAQRGNAFVDSARRTGVDSVGRATVRSRMQVDPEAGVADARPDTWRRLRNAD